MDVSEDYATEHCERKQEQLQAKVEELGREKEKITTRQMELKKVLYGRFGSSINLENS
jgi:prefoldin subunit 4